MNYYEIRLVRDNPNSKFKMDVGYPRHVIFAIEFPTSLMLENIPREHRDGGKTYYTICVTEKTEMAARTKAIAMLKDFNDGRN